ncbi:MAG: EAL domain-containing protein [Bacillota bacterium]
MYKRQNIFFKSIVVFILVLLSTGFVYGNEDEKIKVAFPLMDGFHMMDQHGNLSGYNYDYLMKIAQYTDWEYEFIIIDEETNEKSLYEAMRMVRAGEVDLLGGMNYSEESAEIFEYSMVPAGLNRYTISVLDTTQTFNTESYYYTSDFVIALDASNAKACELALQYFAINQMTPHIVYLESQSNCINFLREGIVDAIVGKEISEFTDLIHITQFSTELFYFVTTLGEQAFAEQLAEAINYVQHNEPYNNSLLKEKYFTTSHTGEIHFTVEDMAFFSEIGQVSVGFLPDTEPFYLPSAEEGVHQGISVDILSEISSLLPISFELIPFDSSEDLLLGLENGTIDMIATLPANYELANMLEVVLTLPYLTSNALRLTFDGHVENVENPTIYTHFIADRIDNSEVQEDLSTVIDLLKKGEADFAYANPYMVQYYIQMNPSVTLETYQVAGVLSDVCFGINKNADVRLAQYINHAILHISSMTLDDIVLKNTSTLHQMTLDNYIQQNFSTYVSIMLVMTVVGGILLGIMHSNKKNALYNIINIDQVTELYTRYKFIEMAEERLAVSSSGEYVIISIDIDNFQYINESYGYEYGTQVLRMLGYHLRSYFGLEALIAREKDDTFLVMIVTEQLPTDKDGEYSELSKAITEIPGIDNKVKTSQGVYFIADKEESVPYMIDCAHSARLLGKRNYMSTVGKFTEDIRKDRTRKNEIVAKMEDALKNQEFQVFYQAKVSFKERQYCGAEALVRWIPKDNTGMIFPDQFIPLFENNGFIIKLDYYVLDTVCQFVAQEGEHNLPKISVNLSGITMMETDLVERVVATLDRYCLSYSAIELEITESAIVNKFKDIIVKIKILRSLGFAVSMDDFGSGISSLNHLKNIDIDILKIDKAFIVDILKEEKSVAIVRNVVNMAKELNLTVVVEGVETKWHVEILSGLGCDIAQHCPRVLFFKASA